MVFVIACLCAASARAEDAEQADDALLSFVAGEYAVVGRAPDGGAAYSGLATIEHDGDVLLMKRRVGDKEVVAEGEADIAVPPGDRRVLRFRWRDPDPKTMTCLAHSDLDNYARLTCVWLADGSEPQQPGLETLFPTAAWGIFQSEEPEREE
jgi:hypothetical protein